MCNAPIQIKDDYKVVRRVACGHCQRCARRRTMSWTLRCLLEASEHTLIDFVTLTYAPDRCPGILQPKDFELFIRRLRNATHKHVRYFCCGEYGGKNDRPHWHVLLFGARVRHRGLAHISPWPYGHVFSGEINRNSAMYVARYTLKSSQLEKPYVVRMSRRPGIGFTTLKKIASKLATRFPEMAYFPPVLSYGGKGYWLDRHAYQCCVNAYTGAGGYLSDEVAPNNHLLDSEVRAMPLETVAKEWLKKTKTGCWLDAEKETGISISAALADQARRFRGLRNSELLFDSSSKTG